ncbi:DUF4129 domain-containing protein [Neobacillus drentensis]|uniref:DUF4129 domain-containing protein n=1 Tax=Neobacillus drentensis TaxID=220684 RepID=UPI002FFFBAB2
MMKRVSAISFHFLLELNISILFLFLYYINVKELPPILLLVVLCTGSIILFTIILSKFLNKGKWIYFATILPLQFVVANQAGLSIVMGTVLGLFVFWRGLSLYEDSSLNSESLLLLFSFLIGLVAIIYSGISHYPYQSQIILLLIIQIVVVLIGDFIRKWSSIDTDKTKFAIYFLKILAALTVIGGIVALLLKYIQFIFFSVLQIFVFLFTSIVGPIFNFIPYFQDMFESKDGKAILHDSDVVEESENFQVQSNGMTQDILFILFILGVVALIIYLIYRKKLKLQTVMRKQSPVVEISEQRFISNPVSRIRMRVTPPENLIRREIFGLERYAHKINLGRLPFETLEEWWKRIGLTHSEELIEIYERVRYGGYTTSNEDAMLISRKIRQLKQKLKDIRKMGHDKNLEG